MPVKRGPIYLAALGVGAVSTAVGAWQAYGAFQLISLEREGKCDWVPCANEGTYLSLALFLALIVVGVVVLAVALRNLE